MPASSSQFLLSCSNKNAKKKLIPYESDYENRLTVFTSHKESVHIPIIREFEEVTGICVKVVTGGTNELLEKIKKNGNDSDVDIMFGGGVESLNAYKDCFQPYVCSESAFINEYYLDTDSFWTPFSSLPVVLVYNPKLVKSTELTSWHDLFNGKFKGKIAFANPNYSASSFTALVTMALAMKGDSVNVLRDFVNCLDKKTFDNSGDIITAVSSGNCLVGITLEEKAGRAVADAKNIAIVYPKDGTSCIPDGTAIVKGCKNLKNAKKFLDFTVSKRTQKLLCNELYRRPIRSDIPVGSNAISLQKISLVDYDTELAGESRVVLLDLWNELMGEKYNEALSFF